MTDGATWHLGVNTLFFIPGKVGGTETYLIETLRAMLPLAQARVTLFTNIENDGPLRACFGDDPRVRFEQLAFRAENRCQRILREQVQLPARVRRAGCDVLWSPGYTACLFARCPQAVTIHDMQYRRFPRDLSPLGWLTTHVLVTAAAWRCRTILTVSAFSRCEIVRLLPVSPDRVQVTLEAAAAAFADTPDDGAPDGRPPYLLCVANSYPHKNLPSLVRAFDAVADSIPHRLVLVGRPGRGERELTRAIATARHRDRLERRSGLAAAELAGLFRHAALFVLPSRYEGFGLPVIEAMRAGVPVVAANCASLPEVGKEGPLYYDPDEPRGLERALLQALAWAPGERAERVAIGRRRAATFTWERTARLTLDALLALCARPGR